MTEPTPTRDRVALVGLVLIAGGLFAAALAFFFGNSTVGLAARWTAIAGLGLHAIRRRSLTTWILVSMIIGAEIGHDWPDVGISLRV